MKKERLHDSTMEDIIILRMKKHGFNTLNNHILTTYHNPLNQIIDQMNDFLSYYPIDGRNRSFELINLTNDLITALSDYMIIEEKHLMPLLKKYDLKPTLNTIIEVGKTTKELEIDHRSIIQMRNLLQEEKEILYQDRTFNEFLEVLEQLIVYTTRLLQFEERILFPLIVKESAVYQT